MTIDPGEADRRFDIQNFDNLQKGDIDLNRSKDRYEVKVTINGQNKTVWVPAGGETKPQALDPLRQMMARVAQLSPAYFPEGRSIADSIEFKEGKMEIIYNDVYAQDLVKVGPETTMTRAERWNSPHDHRQHVKKNDAGKWVKTHTLETSKTTMHNLTAKYNKATSELNDEMSKPEADRDQAKILNLQKKMERYDSKLKAFQMIFTTADNSTQQPSRRSRRSSIGEPPVYQQYPSSPYANHPSVQYRQWDIPATSTPVAGGVSKEYSAGTNYADASAARRSAGSSPDEGDYGSLSVSPPLGVDDMVTDNSVPPFGGISDDELDRADEERRKRALTDATEGGYAAGPVGPDAGVDADTDDEMDIDEKTPPKDDTDAA